MQVQHSHNSSTSGRILVAHVLTLSATEEKTQIVFSQESNDTHESKHVPGTQLYAYHPNNNKKSLPRCPALHPDSDVPLWTLIFFGALMLYLEMSLYGKWLFDQGTSLKQANPSYQIGVVGNFLVASLGSNVSSEDTIP